MLDLTDRKDILYPNKVTRETFPDFRRRFEGNTLGQRLYYDMWMTDYLKVYREGSYLDRLPDPKTLVVSYP